MRENQRTESALRQELSATGRSVAVLEREAELASSRERGQNDSTISEMGRLRERLESIEQERVCLLSDKLSLEDRVFQAEEECMASRSEITRQTRLLRLRAENEDSAEQRARDV